MVECRVVLDLYHFFEGANEIHCCNLDWGDTARIVTENPAIELDDRFAFQPDQIGNVNGRLMSSPSVAQRDGEAMQDGRVEGESNMTG